MMKIAFYIDEFPRYSETFVVDQIVGLISRGFEVSIVTTKIRRDVLLNAVQEYNLFERVQLASNNHGSGLIAKLLTARDTLKSLSNKRFRQYFYHDVLKGSGGAHKLAVLLQANTHFKADAIIAHFGPNAVNAMRMKELGLLSGKIYAVFHGYDMSKYKFIDKYLKSYQHLFSTNMMALPVSHYWKNKLIEFGCPEQKIRVNRMGVDVEEYAFVPKDHIQEPVNIISVARHTHKKGLAYAIEAMAKLKAKGIAFNYSIVGDGPLFETHKALIEKLGLQTQVTLLGYQDQGAIKALLHACDVFLLPSLKSSDGDQEGVPVSLMEAMAMGVICLSTFHSGIPELIENNESGYLVPEKDAQAICDKIEYLLTHNNRDVQRQARVVVEGEFSQNAAYQELSNILMTSIHEDNES